MDQTILFTFGFAVFAFTFIGALAYLNAKKQELKSEVIHFENWGN